VSVHDLADPAVREILEEPAYGGLRDELALLENAGEAFNLQAVLEGHQTPVFFGSAVNNFGVQLLLDAFMRYAPAPGPREARGGPVDSAHDKFSGFIFKMQSNMDPKHRDRIAFLRVCTGRFIRDMQVIHPRTGQPVRLSSSHRIFARERNTVDAAYPGDVIGIVGHSGFRIGDTLTEDPRIAFPPIPRFAPETFAFLHGASASQQKRFRTGLVLREGLAQPFQLKDATRRVPLLGAVGPLQFDVLQHRLQVEYGAESRLESTPWVAIRWVEPDGAAKMAQATLPSGTVVAEDEAGQTVLLFEFEWGVGYFGERNPEIRTTRLPKPMELPGAGSESPTAFQPWRPR
jgi:peptide chain release factor 3